MVFDSFPTPEIKHCIHLASVIVSGRGHLTQSELMSCNQISPGTAELALTGYEAETIASILAPEREFLSKNGANTKKAELNF